MKNKSRIQYSFTLSIWHLAISLLIASFSALFVFLVLYPYPYYQITGSVSIFLMMMAIDVCCGPLCTLVVANPNKSRRETLFDFTIIGSIQLIAVCYGLFSLYTARPVYEVYEKNRFRAVMANEVQIDEFKDALPQFKQLPLLDIQTIGTRPFRNADDQAESISMALAGIEIGLRPSWWAPYNDVIPQVKAQYKPINNLMVTLDNPQQLTLKKSLTKYQLLTNNTYFLPLESSKNEDWIILLNEHAAVVGYAPLNRKTQR